MRQSFKVSFYLRSNYENKEGKSPVMLRIFLGGAMSNLGSTKIFVDKAQWNNRTSRQKGRSSEALAVNASLDAISANSKESLQKYSVLRKHFFEFLVHRYKRKDIGLMEFTPAIIQDF